MRWINFTKDSFVILIITFILLIIINFIILYFSPFILSKQKLTQGIINNLDNCFQTLWNINKVNDIDANTVIVLGDSLAAGMGEEFINGDTDYGLIKKIEKVSSSNFLNFGRSGYGSISSLKEFYFCKNVLGLITTLKLKNKPENFLFVFYEGNDLNNNINYKEPNNEWKRYLRIFLPLFDIPRTYIEDTYLRLKNSKSQKESLERDLLFNNVIIMNKTSNIINITPQSAAMELTNIEIDRSLNIFFETLMKIKKDYNKSNIDVLYIPSVVSVYKWQNPINIHNYQQNPRKITTEKNIERSLLIRKDIEDFCARGICKFCDSTEKLLSISDKKFLHGPIDWKHFNKTGYQIIANSYINCFK